MSASPSEPSPSGPGNARTPTSSGGKPMFIRRPKPADPLRQHRKRPAPVRSQSSKPSSSLAPNGLAPASKPTDLKPLNSNSIPRFQGPGPSIPNGVPTASTAGGFTHPPEGPYQDFPLYTTKKALREGLRYHVARFWSKKDIDPTNQDEFIRPVSLHRRDPRQPPPGKAMRDEERANDIPIDDKEKEKQELARLDKEAQRAADLAQIAPSSNNASSTAAKKNVAFRNEKTTQVHRLDKTEEQKKESDLRYEEALPWHLEDAENKHTWVGNYEAALSDTNVILFVDGDNFKMIPIEKWYKFTPKNQFKTMTIDEAEAQMNQKSKASRWVMHTQQQQQQDLEKQATRRQLGNLYHVKGESSTFKQSGKREIQDADDLDFEDDLFADDDEQPTVEPDNDEETKNTTEKIKREQLGANLFGEGDENEVEKEMKEEEQEEELKRKLGKTTKKALKKREKNYLYDSDSSHPYSSSSENDTSDDEKQKEEDRKKDEEAKPKAKNANKASSGSSSKGTNTPSGRPKHSDPLRKPNHLKRPGSPNLSASETSGNESSRKKHKKKHISSSSQPTGTSTPVLSRQMSPSSSSSQPLPGTSPRKTSIVRLNLNPTKLSEIQSTVPNPAQATSDGEATPGETSDGSGATKRKSIKIRLGGSGSPNSSRAGSPVNVSRAGSPVSTGGTQSNQGAAANTSPISAEEIRAAIPPEGISIQALLKLFSGRIKSGGREKEDSQRFIRMVRENGLFSKEDKLLRPKV
ncbi:MAG: hypothetical protein M1818_001035 [Claussenomyces sp. TS43310]|nr:MAG: hypothetical protein M1818_001035 [Claussenomyces sp. TS43310]